MLIPSCDCVTGVAVSSLSRRVNANSQPEKRDEQLEDKLIKKGEC